MASKGAFSVACIELYGRLWVELDGLLGCDEKKAERLEILRLEIHLLLNGCERARWQTMMSTSQRDALRTTLLNVLLALDIDAEQMSADVIASAQNCLFDALRDVGALSSCAPVLERLREVS
jgi:hypothetical protein